MISSGMRIGTRWQLGEPTGALSTAPVEVVHRRPREAQIYLTLALGISIYPSEFRTVRKSLGHLRASRTVRKAVSLSTSRGGKRKSSGIGPGGGSGHVPQGVAAGGGRGGWPQGGAGGVGRGS